MEKVRWDEVPVQDTVWDAVGGRMHLEMGTR